MDKPGIDEVGCRKIFDSFGRAISGGRLASIPGAAIEALQLLARGAGESGVTVHVAEHNDARGMHPRLNAVRYSGADLPDTGLQASMEGAGLAVSFGCHTAAEEVINLFFDLDVERLPFEEAVRQVSARQLAAVQKSSTRKSAPRRH